MVETKRGREKRRREKKVRIKEVKERRKKEKTKKGEDNRGKEDSERMRDLGWREKSSEIQRRDQEIGSSKVP